MAGRRAESRHRNQEALIAAAERLFMARGYVEVSVQAIAEAAGLTSGAIYSIFGSKLKLLFATLDHRLDRLDSVLASLPDDADQSATAALSAYAQEYHRLVASQDGRKALQLEVDVLAVLLRHGEKTDDGFTWIARRDAHLASLLTGRAVSASAEYRLSDLDAHRLAASASALLRGLAQREALGGEALSADVWAELVSALVAAVETS